MYETLNPKGAINQMRNKNIVLTEQEKFAEQERIARYMARRRYVAAEDARKYRSDRMLFSSPNMSQLSSQFSSIR